MSRSLSYVVSVTFRLVVSWLPPALRKFGEGRSTLKTKLPHKRADYPRCGVALRLRFVHNIKWRLAGSTEMTEPSRRHHLAVNHGDTPGQ